MPTSHPPQTKKNKVSMDMSTDAPDYSLLMKTCKVLYDDDQWYEGIITGCERDKNNIWKYKISFSDGESTYASRDDSEVNFPQHINWSAIVYIQSRFCIHKHF